MKSEIQWKEKRAVHVEAKDLRFGTDAFFSGMKKEEKFMPVITLVVYCGMEHPWDGARCLYELLEIDEELKSFVTNYNLNSALNYNEEGTGTFILNALKIAL